ncbi:MAG: GT4 family glycosyltransferase PelF [Clostridium sp.]
MSKLRICLILEGAYPYVHGGVSTWMHQYITAMKEHEFVLWLIGAYAKNRGKFVFELPDNVVEVHEIFLDAAMEIKGKKAQKYNFTEEEVLALKSFMDCRTPDWNILFQLYHDKKMNPVGFLMSEEFLDILTELCMEKYPYMAFSDSFHTMRSMLLPVLYMLGQEVPKADAYHAIATGYAGVLAALGNYVYQKPMILTEHGIYTREREEEIIRSRWVLPSFKQQWIRFFYMLSDIAYQSAFRITSLFTNARKIQMEIGADPARCIVIENGINYQKFAEIPPKEKNGWIDIGAIVRIAPIKDIKTMIYAFYELSNQNFQVRLHIMGGTDDEEYAEECYSLVRQMGLTNLFFVGRVDIVQYMEKLDFTILTSISEGQPLSILESLAAGRPCVATDVGCCRELLEGGRDDTFGKAGYSVPPMQREGLAVAMEKLCSSDGRRLQMGNNGKKRVEAFYQQNMMMEKYRNLYEEVGNHGRNWI